jgi:Domain of unknown function (DUF397)
MRRVAGPASATRRASLGPVTSTIAPGPWRKSSYSTNNGACVEVAGCQVRDSKDPGGPVLSFTPAAWRAFTEGIKGGELARLSPVTGAVASAVPDLRAAPLGALSAAALDRVMPGGPAVPVAAFQSSI